MKNTMNAQFFMLEFLSTSCAITHENATNGIGLSIFSHLHSNTHS
ncbi:MAG: RAxF-45 family protein [Psychrobacillus psychrotolerans]